MKDGVKEGGKEVGANMTVGVVSISSRQRAVNHDIHLTSGKAKETYTVKIID